MTISKCQNKLPFAIENDFKKIQDSAIIFIDPNKNDIFDNSIQIKQKHKITEKINFPMKKIFLQVIMKKKSHIN